jgi:antitoxin component YwqK of YwqJK toxin-antitoxin module
MKSALRSFRMQHYRSSIPKNARERIVARYSDTRHPMIAEYRLNRSLVGIRRFHPTGELMHENPIRHEMMHGIVYRCDEPGKVISAEPWSYGLPHGVARQYSHDGALLGTYQMKRGTGLDLWWQEAHEGAPWLSEARYLRDGKWHGFEWWLREDQKNVWEERHFASGQPHGVERQWNSAGRLKRGFPRYWVKGRRVTRHEYLRLSARDESLPRFREGDNSPRRKFPPEVTQHLR